MAKATERRKWAEDFLRSLRPPTDEELKQRRLVFERAWKNREKLDIRPLTTTELVRQLRDES
jgi:hypothetical protein